MKWLIMAAICFPWSVFIALALFLSRGNKKNIAAFAGLFLVPALSGCFQPDLTDVMFRCTRENAQCLPGLVCDVDAGACVSDLGSEQGPDLSAIADMTSDLAQPDAEGCATPKTGIKIAEGVFLCPGAFSEFSPVGKLCATGWTIPKVWPAIADNRVCSTLAAGFVIDSIGSYPGVQENMPSCGSLSLDQRFVVACGPVTSVFSVSSAGACAGLTTRFLCNGATKPDSPVCPKNVTSLDQLSSRTSKGGAVCQRL